jgi:nucleoside-diphosphate-sugar epimerase
MTNNILITGGNGFLALHIIQQLLAQGDHVRATVRNDARAAETKATLTAAHTLNMANLTFVNLDLTQDAGWQDAMAGIDVVMSVAAPVFVNGESNANALAKIATDGTLRILHAAEAAGVQRVILTGNFGAVGFSNLDPQRVTTEADWTNPDQRGLSLYERSKLLAERAAWEYVQQPDVSMRLTTINAGAMLGSALGDHVSGSFGILRSLVDGSLERVPRLDFNVVDVHDVASMHVAALNTPAAASQRFLAVADDAISYPDIRRLLQAALPQRQLSTKILPSWLVHLAGHFNARAREADLMLRMSHRVSNQHAKDLLNWQPQSSATQAVQAAIASLITSKQI